MQASFLQAFACCNWLFAATDGVKDLTAFDGVCVAAAAAAAAVWLWFCGLQVAEALRDVDAAFPSVAAPHQPIKLPKQHNVGKEEYKEFLNLGHGEIFSLDLDR
jgi:hypothetical protein